MTHTRIFLCIVLCFLPVVVQSFSLHQHQQQHQQQQPFLGKTTTALQQSSASLSSSSSFSSSSVSVPASVIEKNLSGGDETLTVRVVRKAGPSVAFVTSVWPLRTMNNNDSSSSSSSSSSNKNRQQQQQQQQQQSPRGQSLGSGSAFCVDSAGYLVTNYHVIESAHQIQTMESMAESMRESILGNLTSALSNVKLFDTRQLVESIEQQSKKSRSNQQQRRPLPQVYVRIDRSTRFQKCRIVDVKPELDLAVLKIEPDDNKEETEELNIPALQFGSSADLLVGQSVVAIGNPFGLDNSVSKGVVSALNRELQNGGGGRYSRPPRMAPPTTSNNVIRNCIQTDCSINAGSSGGPLLTLQGTVVGVNTAIVTTTGSFAGIGFAVPTTDAIQPAVEGIIRQDKLKTRLQNIKGKGRTRPPAWLGVKLVRIARRDTDSDDSLLSSSSSSRAAPNKESLLTRKNWILRVAPNSPAAEAGMRGLKWSQDNDDYDSSASSTVVDYGDAIVAVNGQDVKTYQDLEQLVDKSIVGEQWTVTLEDANGERRVVYLTLAERKS